MLKAILTALSVGAACFLFFYFRGEEVPLLVERGLWAAGLTLVLSLLALLSFRAFRQRAQRKCPAAEIPYTPPEIQTLRSKSPEELAQDKQQAQGKTDLSRQ